DRKGVRRSGLVGISTSMLIVAFCMVAIAMNREAIVSIFITPKTEADLKVFQLASKFLIILAAMQLLNELDTTANAALLGIKDSFVPMIINIVSYWGVGLSSAYFLIFYGHLQSSGLLISSYLATLVPAVTLSLRFYFKTSDVTQFSK
ncbi:MAG: MATE family efflux transporter, partial [Symploca sp. SIO3E6]|nr:MATE family efflux transporter [Caldora sp. SIO3E6]